MPQQGSKIRQIQANAERLQQIVATTRLLGHVFSGFREESAPAGRDDILPVGRYAILSEVIATTPPLREALSSERRGAIDREWRLLLEKRQSDVRFLHAMAVIYREQARWQISAPLWAALFSCRDFWDYFSDSRFTDRGSGDRRPLDEGERTAIFQETLRAILGPHRILGSSEFAAGRFDVARVHLSCLNVCRLGGEGLLHTLREHGQPCTLKLDSGLLASVTELAASLLDDWCAALVHEAEKETEDPEAIKSLPEGVRKNYEGGILRLEPFVNLNIPVVRVLHKSLHWYNDWCYDLYVKRELQRIRAVLEPARKLADQLIPQCIQGRDFDPANQALSQHFLLRGFSNDGPADRAMEAYREALRWNAANANARDLLGGAVREVLMERLDTTVKCADRNQFREAHEVLDSIEKEVAARERAAKESLEDAKETKSIQEDKKTVREVRAIVHFRNANHLAEEGSFRSALEFAAKARQADPDQPVIQKFHAEMQELAPEEDNLRNLRVANEGMEKDRYDQSIAAAEKIGAKSKFHDRGRRILAGAHFRRAIAAANEEKFAPAEVDLERSLSFCDDAKEREIISKQLGVIRHARRGKALREAADRDDWPQAQRILRDALKAQLSPKESQGLRKELSAVLNAQAVSMIHKVQETEKQFGDALGAIIAEVKSRQGMGL